MGLKRKAVALAAAMNLLAVPFAASAQTSNQSIDVNTTITPLPAASFGTNFNTLELTGRVDDSFLTATAKNTSGSIVSPELSITSHENYEIYATATDLVSSIDSTRKLSGSRLIASVSSGTGINLSNNISSPASIFSGTGNGQTTSQAIDFKLDLNTVSTNNYTDNDILKNLSATENFQSTITLSYTGL